MLTDTYSVMDYLAKCCEGDIEKPINTAAYTGGIDGVEDYHAKVELSDADTIIRLYFRAENVEGLRFTCGEHEIKGPTNEDSGLWSVAVSGVSVAELPADLVITGTKGEESVTIQFSPFYYAARYWDKTEDPFVLLCRALAAAIANAET